MRAVPLLFLVLVCFGAQSEEIVEANTKESFPSEMTAGEATLSCTGVTVRQKYGFDIYAIAHYGDAAGTAGSPEDVPARRAYWQAAKTGKAFAIHFVFFVDEGNLRQACEESLDAAGYTGDKQEAFLEVFARDYPAGSEMKLIADKAGKLSAEYKGEAMGSWEDPALVAALWQSWLGEASVVETPEALVARSVAPAAP